MDNSKVTAMLSEPLQKDGFFLMVEFHRVIPPSLPSTPGRRPSQVSALSTAYTVKSLPGAMLYIPVGQSSRTTQHVMSQAEIKPN